MLKRNINKNKLLFYNEEVSNLSALIALITLIITTTIFFFDKWSVIKENIEYALITVLLLIYGVAIFLYNMLKTPVERARAEFIELIKNKYYLQLVFRNLFSRNALILNEDEVINSINEWYKKNEPKRFSNIIFKNESFQTIVKHLGVDDFKFILFTEAENIGLITVEEINFEGVQHFRYTLSLDLFPAIST